ncbi:hypothetical protein KCP70_22405 [Salmonella enterica subsp. enterica]|nr:hypothetical protein KCP70_22405 [Salmonella enterica subsp. enterica]
MPAGRQTDEKKATNELPIFCQLFFGTNKVGYKAPERIKSSDSKKKLTISAVAKIKMTPLRGAPPHKLHKKWLCGIRQPRIKAF